MSASGPSPTALLTEQLWAPSLEDDAVRITHDRGSAPGWTAAESYWMFPSPDRAKLLLPRGPHRVTSAAATHYRGLRRPLKNVGRSALGAAARVGVPVSPGVLSVLVRDGLPEAEQSLPLATMRRLLDVPRLYAATGVRVGANRKATLHLLTADARPAGYAKVAWNTVTDAFVATEGATLRAVGGRAGAMRAPALLAEGELHGHPVIVTEPLPLAVRGARSQRVAPPTTQELYALCPVRRQGPAALTAQFDAVSRRLEALADTALTAEVVDRARHLAHGVRARTVTLPVTERWHGDLTPWNRARDETGQLWVWDWESAEPDAVAGLDALHWAYSVGRDASGRSDAVDLGGWLRDAEPHLRGAGVRPEAWADVAAVYAVTIAERAADLARRSGGWERLWISPTQLLELLRQAETQLDQSSGLPR